MDWTSCRNEMELLREKRIKERKPRIKYFYSHKLWTWIFQLLVAAASPEVCFCRWGLYQFLQNNQILAVWQCKIALCFAYSISALVYLKLWFFSSVEEMEEAHLVCLPQHPSSPLLTVSKYSLDTTCSQCIK